MIRRLVVIALWAFSLCCFSIPGSAMDRIPVFVSIVPQKYFMTQIGGELLDIQVMVQPGASPATYEPKPRQMADLARARAYFAVGVPFEQVWLPRIAAANPEMEVVHTDQGIPKLAMDAHHDHDTHHHQDDEEAASGEDQHHAEEHHDAHAGGGDGGHHMEGGLDPHIWLSPPLVKQQARTMLAALKEIDPSHAARYEANCRRFLADVDALDAELRQTFAGRQGFRFMVFHPSWGYFAHAYGLVQMPIEIEGKEPKPAQLSALITYAREKGIRVVFVQPQFSSKSARLIAGEIDGQVAFADPLAEDWMANLRAVAEKFKAALK